MTSKKENKEEDYHGVAPVSSIVKKMKKAYDKDPKDWRIIGSRDKDRNADTFITKKPNLYWLKSKQISPFSALSMGTEVRNIDKDIDEQVGKKMSTNDMLRLFGMVVPVKKNKNIVAAGIEKYSEDHGNHLKTIVEERDSNIGYQMARRIDEEFTKKYPQRKNLYI
ncbi:MAG: hypothetical protein GF383_01230 [Candidatus Lokiarchaeota archaeon]|nr:hypothetical protein [Candidatus Lokiarchaeota archaeon]MBD3337873.1 hypothetical protein [Candidatus Lokiarchaeota archaeon]